MLTRLLGIPAEQVGLLPRAQIALPSGAPPAFPDPQLPFTLVLSGRVSATKNIETALRMVHFLQMDHGLPVTLAVLGAFDDEIHLDWGRREPEPYEPRMRRLLEELEWRVPPRLLGKLPAEEWTRLPFERPVYLSLSTFICEDFGFAQAQAQAAGWPSVLSDWGGHRDVGREWAIRIPPELIAHSHEPAPLLRLKARHLAAYLAARLRERAARADTAREETTRRGTSRGETAQKPAPISVEELDALRRAWIERIGPDALLLQRGERGIDLFADTAAGQRFFSEYRLLFSGQGSEPLHHRVLLANDLNDSPDPRARRIREVAERYEREHRASGEPLFLLPLRGLSNPAHALRLATASEVVLPFEAPELMPALRALRSGFPEEEAARVAP